MGSTYQILEAPNMSTYIGAGKVAEVARAVRAWRADTVIFDDELSPGQLRNLEKAFSGGKEGAGEAVRVCDRTALILDIFSQRAATREGKLQVGRCC
jgi:GTP-binding protein HflX